MTHSETIVLKKLYELRHTQDFVKIGILQATGLSQAELINAVSGLVDHGLVEWMPHEESRSPIGGIDNFVAKITDEGISFIAQGL
jgi:hypothetical protein